jgi:hypothetical protein
MLFGFLLSNNNIVINFYNIHLLIFLKAINYYFYGINKIISSGQN